nr:retrovirus-related Pol polyprotein from transposon TNT 1-94 [Tanacetum cinerariifolium]
MKLHPIGHINTCPKEFSKRDKKVATTLLDRNKKVAFRETCGTSNNNTQTHVEQQKVQKTNVPVIPSTEVNNSTKASESKPRSNTKNNRILPAKSDNKKKVEAHPRSNKSNLKQENHWKPTERKFTLGEQYPLTRFIKSKVVPLQQPEHVSSSEIIIIERFSNTTKKQLTRKHSRCVRNVDGVDLLKGSRGSNLYTISIEDMIKSSLICLLSKASKNKSWVWHRRLNHLNFGTINDLARQDLNGIVKRQNRTLVEAAQTTLIYSKALMFLRAEALATTCYTQNRSVIHTHHNKTPYELVHDKKPNLTFLCIFGALCYPTNDSEDLGKLKGKQ